MADLQTKRPRNILTRIFISATEARLRAGWRLLIQTVLMMILFVIIGVLLSFVSEIFSGSSVSPESDLFLGQIIEFVVFLISIYIARRLLDKRPFTSLGLTLNSQALVDVLAGVAITFLIMGFIYIIEIAAGWLQFVDFAWEVEPLTAVIGSTLSIVVIFIFVGWNEELLSRGYHLQTIASGMNLTWGVLLSSGVFGIMHLGNPNATWISAGGIFLAGVFLAYAYVRTKQLWLSIGLHIGWNFFEGVVFGFPVSGLDVYQLTRNHFQGPELWTGGAFGPEAGLVVIPGLVLGIALVYFYSNSLRKPVE